MHIRVLRMGVPYIGKAIHETSPTCTLTHSYHRNKTTPPPFYFPPLGVYLKVSPNPIIHTLLASNASFSRY